MPQRHPQTMLQFYQIIIYFNNNQLFIHHMIIKSQKKNNQAAAVGEFLFISLFIQIYIKRVGAKVINWKKQSHESGVVKVSEFK